jgi:hypothetical protein
MGIPESGPARVLGLPQRPAVIHSKPALADRLYLTSRSLAGAGSICPPCSMTSRGSPAIARAGLTGLQGAPAYYPGETPPYPGITHPRASLLDCAGAPNGAPASLRSRVVPRKLPILLAPWAGFEPATNRLTASFLGSLFLVSRYSNRKRTDSQLGSG